MEDILVKTLKATINDLEDNLKAERTKVTERDKLIKGYQEEQEVLLNNLSELRAKIADLENNLDFVVNNIDDTKLKEVLVRDRKSIN